MWPVIGRILAAVARQPVARRAVATALGAIAAWLADLAATYGHGDGLGALLAIFGL